MAVQPTKEEARSEFAARLREAIHRFGIQPCEQARLGRMFGVTGQAARKWVEGLNMPTRENIAYIARALGVRRAWLEYGEGPMYPERALAEPAAAGYDQPEEAVTLDERELRLLLAYRRLDVTARAALDEIVERLAAAGGSDRVSSAADGS